MAAQAPGRKILLVHPGTQYSYKLAEQLSKRNYLYFFYTGLAIAYKSIGYRLFKLLPLTFQKKISNRVIYGIRPNELKLFPLHEINALIRVKRKDANNDIFFQRNEAFQKDLPEKVIRKADAVISFDTTSWILAERSRKVGKYFILDVSIAHSISKQKVYKKILNNYSDWQFNIEMKKDEYMALEQKEYELADALVVASSFTKNTLIENGIEPNRIYINPYGVDLNKFYVNRKSRKDKKLRFLFVGLVDARKGVPLLMDVWQRFKSDNVELNLVGPVSEEVIALIKKEKVSSVNIAGKVPHDALPEIFHNNDIFIFPSYFEGFALVILEAMACGLPVITTTATAGPDIIENGQDGFIVEPGDVEGLEKAIRYFIDNDHLINIIGDKARTKAESFTWDAYGSRWINIIDSVMEKNNKLD